MFEVPGIKERDFMTLLSSNISHRYPLNFLKIESDVLNYSLVPGALNMVILVASMRSFYFWHSLTIV